MSDDTHTEPPGGSTDTVLRELDAVKATLAARERELAALRESEARYRTLLEASRDLVFLIGRDDTVRYVNPAAAHAFGLEPQAIAGKPRSELFPPAIAERQSRSLAHVVETGEPMSIEAPAAFGGREVWLESWLIPVRDAAGEVEGVLGVSRDVTDRRRAQEALRESDKLWRGIMACETVLITLVDPSGVIFDLNEACRAALTSGDEDLRGRNVFDLFDPESTSRRRAWFDEVVRTGKPLRVADARRGRFFEGSRFPVQDADGKVSRIILMVTEITDRQRAEEALRESEARFRQMAETIREVFWMTDPEGAEVLYVSPAFEELWGRTCAAAYAEPELWLEAIHPEDRERAAAVARRQILGEATEQEYRIVRPDGSIRWVWDRAFPIRDDQGRSYRIAGIAEDITEKRQVEAELQRIAKLESLGALAGGLAHDFNNLLTGIMANITLARLAGAKPEAVEALEESERAILRAKLLTQQLVTFAEGGAPVKAVASLADVIRDTAEFGLSGSNVRCRFAIAGDLWPVEADVGQISQVIQNLVINADQALREGGAIDVAAENCILGEGELPPLGAGRHLKLAITDHGEGISGDRLARVFDPFFTTKETGTGLGLTICHSIIRAHGGHIRIESAPGAGTRVEVYLPASDGEPLPKAPSPPHRLAGQGRVLLMDDEGAIRRAARHLLAGIGYDVECAEDGAEAVERYQAACDEGRPFDVVLLDLTVPGGMGGRECIGRLREIAPAVKAIVWSGYSGEPVLAESRRHGFQAVLPKPFTLEQLSEALDRVIRNDAR